MAFWLDGYEQGHFIDSKDTMNTWCVGKIIKIDPEVKTVTVRYEGWSDKWDSTFPFHSNRIAPFRMHSALYTGQKGNALRSFYFAEDYLISLAERLNDLPKTAFEITQFLRGELFTSVDCLLVHDYKNSQELDKTIQFLTQVIKFVVEWIRNSDKHFKILAESTSDAFLNNVQVAFAASWKELIFTLKRIFALDNRTAKNLIGWTRVPEEYVFNADTENRSKTLNYFVNYFHSIGGFQAILDMLSENE
jgi:hypothetical protein